MSLQSTEPGYLRITRPAIALKSSPNFKDINAYPNWGGVPKVNQTILQRSV